MSKRISSIERLKDYFSTKEIKIDLDNQLKETIVRSGDLRDLPDDIIPRIIAEAHGLDKYPVNEFSTYLEKLANRRLLWLQKEYIKRYIGYEQEEDFEKLKTLIKEGFPPETVWKTKLTEICTDYRRKIKKADELFLTPLLNEIKNNNERRVKDYIVFLYSRLVGLNENYYTSLKKLFDDNKNAIKNNISERGFKELKDLCQDDGKIERIKAVATFSAAYIDELRIDDGSREKKSLIYFNVNQSILDNSGSLDAFYDRILSVLRQSYNDLQNHKTLAVRIQNIYHDNINIKWEIYSFLVTYAETFNVYEERRSYYSPSVTCRDHLEQRYGLQLGNNEIKELDSYFKGSKDFHSLNFLIDRGISQDDIDSFKKIITGFSFSDAFVLTTKEDIPNSKEIEFIKNNTELLLIFFKNEIDDRKIPCPVCGSFKTSGNSFPEVGIRSWECKNPLCSERSKTNRGKRFSLRSNLMQNALFDLSNENQISRDITKKWRKDIVRNWTLEDLYIMLIKYYSFVGDKIGTINCENEKIFKDLCLSNKRGYVSIDYNEYLKKVEINGIFEKFISESEFIRRFYYLNQVPRENGSNSKTRQYNFAIGEPVFFLGDSQVVLKYLKDDSIHNMVTSPPYYNAREYSKWNSFYQYLNDMLQVIYISYKKLVDGGVFFYNIGDTYGNPNTVIKSKMGEKRMALGAYAILLFKLVGFDILDNIVWDKGEPQSNRHKNSGKFTAYYQRPANCYEHMLIFKKKGTLHLNKHFEQNRLKSNIQTFSPVIKIGVNGENRYGHTAPFPKKIPELSIFCFTNEGEIVLDPYSGSGTTAITAATYMRIGIGIEKNPEYYKLSLNKAKEYKSPSNVTLWEYFGN